MPPATLNSEEPPIHPQDQSTKVTHLADEAPATTGPPNDYQPHIFLISEYLEATNHTHNYEEPHITPQRHS